MTRQSKEGPLGVTIFLIIFIFLSSLTPHPSFAKISDLVVDNCRLVSKKRVGRTNFTFTFTADITNNGTEDAVDVSAECTSFVQSATVTDRSLTFGDVPAGATIVSDDTFSVTINRRYPFHESNLGWTAAATIDSPAAQLRDLILHYRMNAIDSGAVVDAVDVANNGVIFPLSPGSLPFTADNMGKPAEALVFDGVSNYVEARRSIIPTSGDFTVSAWAWLDGGSDGYRIILSQGDSGNNISLGLHENGNVMVGSDWEDTLKVFPSTDAWHHFAVTKSAAGKSLYIDGMQVETAASATANPASTTFQVGTRYSDPAQCWHGSIDEVRVYETALTAAEVGELYDIGMPLEPKGMIAHYKLDDYAENTDVRDSAEETYDTIYKHDGVSVRNTKDISTAGHLGDPQSAFAFNGTSDYVEVAEGIDLSQQDDFSVSVWAMSDGETGDFRRIFSQGIFGDYFSLGKHANGNVSVGVGWPDTEVAYPSWNEWHHFVVTRSVNKTKLYIDGELKATLDSAHIKPANTPFRIGCQFGTVGEYWNGKIDDLRVFGSTLDPDQVKSLYHGMVFNHVAVTESESHNMCTLGVDNPLLPDKNMPDPGSYGPDRHKYDGAVKYGPDPLSHYKESTDKAIYHDGNDSYYRMSPHQVAKLNSAMTKESGAWNNFTLTAWIKIDPAAVGSRWIVLAGSGNSYTGLLMENAAMLFGAVQAPGGNDTVVIQPDDGAGRWYHAALSYDGTNTKLYMNGTLMSEEVMDEDGPLGKLGSFGISPYGDYHGAVDDVHLYARALGPEEIRADMLTEYGANRVFTYYFAGTGMHVANSLFHYADFGSNDEMISQLVKAHINKAPDALGGSDGIGFGEVAECKLQPCDFPLGYWNCWRKWVTINNEFTTALVAELVKPGKIILNLVGFSRGAVSAIWQAHRIARGTDPDPPVGQGPPLTGLKDRIAHINILAFEPVPAQNPFCLLPEIFHLPPIVRNYIGIYARDERTGGNPTYVDTSVWIPSVEDDSKTKAWHLLLPGAHETIVGNAQWDGHDFNNIVNNGYSPHSRSVSIVGAIIAREAFMNSEWGSIAFGPNVYPPSYTAQEFKGNWNNFSNISDFAVCRRTSFLGDYASFWNSEPRAIWNHSGDACWSFNFILMSDYSMQENGRCSLLSTGLEPPDDTTDNKIESRALSNMNWTSNGIFDSIMDAEEACFAMQEYTSVTWTDAECADEE